MKIYQVNGKNSLILSESRDDAEDGVKVKISKILLSLSDIALYQGKIKAGFPLIPCHAATAIISEDRPDLAFKRGQKVLLSPYLSKNCDYDYADCSLYGIETDGFLRNFATLPVDTVIPLPEEVKENQAVFAEFISVALAAVDSLKLQKGDYVAVIGATLLNNLVAQLALYYQAIPIIIDSDPKRLELAEDCGVYYTVNEQEEDPCARVLQITGGRMANHCILHARSYTTPNFLFSLAGENANCVIVSVSGHMPRLDADISQIVKKNLKVKGVTSGADKLEASINLLLQKTLRLDGLVDKISSFETAPQLFEELSKDFNKYFCSMIEV